MQPTSDIAAAMPIYGSNATSYREPPSTTQIEDGVIPLDSLPADWWNWLWYNITTDEAKIVSNLGSIFNEIIAVLTAAGKTPSATDSTQLLESIRSLCRVVATTTTRGAVLSSTASGQLAVDSDGKSTINDLGTPASLDTTDKTVVGAINEVYAAVANLSNTYAPKSHASSATTYGVGTTSAYGHVMVCAANGLSISNGIISMGNATISTTTYPGACCTGTVTKVCLNGTAYSPTSGAVNLGNITGFPGYGTAVPCVAGTAAVGSSTTASRSDHVHPLPWCNCCNIAIGCSATASSTFGAIAIGKSASATMDYGIAIGCYSCVRCCEGVAIGSMASACNRRSTALGYGAVARCIADVAVGNSQACCGCSVAIGYGAVSCIAKGVAIGCGTKTYVCDSCVCVHASVGPIFAVTWDQASLQCSLAKTLLSLVGYCGYNRLIPVSGTLDVFRPIYALCATDTCLSIYYHPSPTNMAVCICVISCGAGTAEIVAGCMLIMR